MARRRVGDHAQAAAERELARQLWIQRTIADLSRRVLALAPDEIDEGVRQHLATAAALAGAERLRLVVTGEGRAEIHAVYEWCAEGIDPTPSDVARRGLRFRWAVALLARGEAVHVPRVDALPPEAGAEREDLLARGVRSLLALPVCARDALIGYQIFERFALERGWSDQEQTQLRLVGEIFANAIKRKRSEEILARQRSVERRVAELSRRFLALGPDAIDGAIEAALAEAADIAGADRSYLMAFERPSSGRFESYEWCAPGVRRAPPPDRDLPWSRRKMLQGEILHVPRIAALPAGAEVEREDLTRRGVRSLLGIPVLSEHKALGYLGFETVRREKAWSEQEITLLRLIGELFTSALHRKRTEARLRESQEQLLQAQKLDAVGRLAGGIAHDFNNLLTVILGFSRPLLRDLPEGDPVRADVREIHEAAERAAALTRQLLTFSRRQPLSERPVDLSGAVRGLEDLLRRLLGEDVELRLETAPDLHLVRIDPHRFEQVVLNLAVNARDAMPDGGQLAIRTENRQLGPAEARRLGIAPGACVRLAVADTGCGIDPETRAHIFDPFFTTKQPGRGTGLGLAIVYSAIEQAGGAIAVEGRPGKGTVFELYFPRATDAAGDDAPAERDPERPGSECVLLVEDEPAVRRLACRILEEAGYRVLEAADGAAALSAAARHGDEIDLLLTDVVMPRVGGIELARRLREERPGLPVLLVSGYPPDGDPADRARDLLHKPFSAASLRARVREILDRAS